MCAVFEISTTDYSNNSFQIKKALSQIETICKVRGGYELGEPQSKFGWTFAKLLIHPSLENEIKIRFSDMINKYRFSKEPEKFKKFLDDYLKSKGCNISLKQIE
jgi:hypothetical protein